MRCACRWPARDPPPPIRLPKPPLQRLVRALLCCQGRSFIDSPFTPLSPLLPDLLFHLPSKSAPILVSRLHRLVTIFNSPSNCEVTSRRQLANPLAAPPQTDIDPSSTASEKYKGIGRTYLPCAPPPLPLPGPDPETWHGDSTAPLCYTVLPNQYSISNLCSGGSSSLPSLMLTLRRST